MTQIQGKCVCVDLGVISKRVDAALGVNKLLKGKGVECEKSEG